jgi:hypothetical protein
MELTDFMKESLTRAVDALKGSDRRLFMARTVLSLGRGGQRQAERELGWNRVTMRKGAQELRSGCVCVDAFNWRGRMRAEKKLPTLLQDIRALVTGQSSVDPTFRTSRLYTRLTAEEVRRQLITQNRYRSNQLPTARTLRTKLNELGFRLRTVVKSKPKKRFHKQTLSSRKFTE